MIARQTRKITIMTGETKPLRDLEKSAPCLTILYYKSGGGTLEISKAADMDSGDGIVVPPDVPYKDFDRSLERYGYAKNDIVELIVEEYDA